ncbi:hypothetical protein BTM277_13770 [Helicobacter pylori]
MEKNDRYAVVTNVIESLEKGGSFNSIKEIVRNLHKSLERMGLKTALLKK